ncbi:MAG: polysaccharide deacetylase family protein [Atopobiaceae bacterium]|nr:polysaccharide deacetylase family protein [Atopobiaceae bacterium]MCI2173455.1 polysaccharide deacetylase family protein [Atopobiaceae bacterium]MCI2207450.1 polysaccharide deacetylase family protein [Atopobiaceae bacterium]
MSYGQGTGSRGSRGVQGGHFASSGQVNPYLSYTSPAARPGSGRSGHGGSRKPRRRHTGRNVAIACVLVLVACVGVYLFLNPPFYDVTVNGARVTVDSGSTIQTVIDKGYASPKAGNLMAIDGSVATQGGGDPFSAVVDGTTTADPTTKLAKDSTVDISDGADATETYTETTQTVAHGTSDSDESAASYYKGSIHVLSAGEDGEETVRTGDVSGKTVTEVTKQPVDSGYSSYNANVGDRKVVALTFDDGPWPTTTSEILDVLKDNGVHATFFEIGNQISENADVVKRIHDEGNQIGSHTWDHASGSGQGVNLTYMTADEQVQEVEKGFDAIDSTLGTQVTRTFRAPGGNYYGSLISNLQPYVTVEVGWNIDTEDWRRPGVDSIVKAIESAQPGDVILCHDGGGDRSQTVEALKTAIPYLKGQGYEFVTIDELLSSSTQA